jgi:protein-arginine kinase activator protein McsA
MFDADDKDDQRQILCERCRKFVPLSHIKYVAKGNESKMALCNKCLKAFSVSPSQIRKDSLASKPESRFVCERCSYTFTMKDSSSANLRCPYCGRDDKIVDANTKSAGHLLRMSEDF